MAIHAPVPEEREWQNPPEGVHQGVIYAVELQEKVETKFGVKDRLLIKIQLNPDSAGTATYKDDNGQDKTNPYAVMMRPALSMFRDGTKASTLRKFVEAVSGQKFPDNKSASAYDLEQLVGMNGMFNIVHNKSEDGTKTFANVETVMPLPKGIKPIQAVGVTNGNNDLPF